MEATPRSIFFRAGRTLLLCLTLIASLLTFPSGLPYMLAFWLGAHTLLNLRGSRAWPALLIPSIIVLIKDVAMMPGLILLLSLVGGTIVFDLVRGKRPLPRALLPLLLWGAWLGMLLDWEASARSSRSLALQGDRPIVCLGDSLTAGGYPKELGELVRVPVIDLGRKGINTEEGVRMIPDILLANPQFVVIELGGHDFLQKRPVDRTKENLEIIIEAARSCGAEVVLFEIPRGFITDGYAGLDRRIARDYDLELIPDTALRSLVLWSPHVPPGRWMKEGHLSDDGLHPNANGHRFLAAAVLKALQRLTGDAILKAP